MRIGQKYILNSNFLADQWVKIYDTILSSAATSVTISGLDGDTDEEYRLILKIIGSGSNNLIIRPNNDSGNNYGLQRLAAYSTTTAAYRATSQNSFIISWNGLVNNYTNMYILNLYAKSGFIRTLLDSSVEWINGTTVDLIYITGQSWNNTADNLTSLVISADGGSANGLSAGTSFELYKKKYKS